MCMADDAFASVSVAPLHEVRWRAPMCGPYFHVFAMADHRSLERRAIEAYRQATEDILAARYEDARLQLDLAHRGLPRIADRIALQSGRLELLRERPWRAARFFEEASESPHDSVRVEAAFGHAFALLRADDPSGDERVAELLEAYPSIPNRAELSYEQAQSLIRRRRHAEAAALLHAIRVEHPGDRAAPLAESELRRLRSLGYETPAMTDEDRVTRARELVRMGPLDAAKLAVGELLDTSLTGEHHAEIYYLAGRLAKYEGRWNDAESHMRNAQTFPIGDAIAARRIQDRAEDIAETARARDRDLALERLSELRQGKTSAQLSSSRLTEMIAIASAAGIRDEVDGMLSVLARRPGVPASSLFEAAMGAVGTGSEERIAALLEQIAKRGHSAYRIAALYHLARAHERAGRLADAGLFFEHARNAAREAGDRYYVVWAESGLQRLESPDRTARPEGLIDPGAAIPTTPKPPRAREDALAEALDPIGRKHADRYPWIAMAVVLVGTFMRARSTCCG